MHLNLPVTDVHVHHPVTRATGRNKRNRTFKILNDDAGPSTGTEAEGFQRFVKYFIKQKRASVDMREAELASPSPDVFQTKGQLKYMLIPGLIRSAIPPRRAA